MTRTRFYNPQFDLFLPTIVDLRFRDQKDTMERPFFSLAKKKRVKPIEYRNKSDGIFVTVQPHQDYGMATIWDADILIWAATQITEALDRGLTPTRVIHFHPHNLLKSIRRPTGGEHYLRLRAALDRLTHTAVRTNIRADGKKKAASFHSLESWTELTDERTGETTGMTLTLPDWLFQGIVMKGGVLYDGSTLDEIWPDKKPFGEYYWANPDVTRTDVRSVGSEQKQP